MLKSSKTMVRVKETELERAKKNKLQLEDPENSTLPIINSSRPPLANYSNKAASSKPIKYFHTPKASSVSQSLQDRKNFIRKLALDKNPPMKGQIDAYHTSFSQRESYKKDENSHASFRKSPNQQSLSENKDSSIDHHEAYSRVRTPENRSIESGYQIGFVEKIPNDSNTNSVNSKFFL
jgi:hypothetical protein